MFGKSKTTKTTSKVERPAYLTNFVKSVASEIPNADVGTYSNLAFAGLNDDQRAAIQQMYNNPQLTAQAQQLIDSGQQGLTQLDNVYQQISNAYSDNNLSPEKLNQLATQLYSPSDVQAAQEASNALKERQFSISTMPAVAQQTMQQSGFGSSRRLAGDLATESLANEEAQTNSEIANNAYNAALSQAQNIASGNQQNKLNALNALSNAALSQSQNINAGANLSQSMLNTGLNAAQQSYNQRANELANTYQNQVYNDGWRKGQISNQLQAAGILNGILTPTTTTTSKSSGGMLSGMMSGAAAGSAFGPWGALAGGIAGAAAS